MLLSILITAIILLLVIQIFRKREIIKQLTRKERYLALTSYCGLFTLMIIGYHFLDKWIMLLDVTKFIRSVVFFVYCVITVCLIAVLLERMLPKKLLSVLLKQR